MSKNLRLLLSLLLIIFGSEAVSHFGTKLFPLNNQYLESVADAFSIMILSAPFFYIIISRERKRSDKYQQESLKNFEISKQALINLEQSSILQKAILNGTSYGIIATTPDGTITSFNRGAEQMLGYNADELIDKLSPAVFHDLDEVIAKAASLSEEMKVEVTPGFTVFVLKARLFNIPDTNTWTYIKKDGTRIKVNLTVTALRNELEEIIGYLGVAEDITEKLIRENEKHKAAELQNAILNGTKYSIISTALDGTIVLFNKGAEEMLGYKAEEMVNIQSPAIIHDFNEVVAKAKVLSEEFGYEIEPGIDVFHLKSRLGIEDVNDWTYIRKDGSRLTVSLSITTLKDSEGNIYGYLGIAKDVTLENQAKQELIHAKELAEAASLAKSDFLANMSHEIRTPLNGVIGFSDLLLKTKLNESQQQYMNVVFQSANSLLDIINDILDFSKIEAGKLELAIEKTDLLQLTSQIGDVVSYQVQQKKLEMLLNIPVDLPRFIWTDAIRLRQVLINLLSNSVKFTEKGEIELKIEVLNKSKFEATYRFSVRDTGLGIEPQNLEKIFKAFEQEDTSTTRKFGGTGLGLSIANKLLALMNSTSLQVKSEVGKGSVFYFDIIFKTEDGEPLIYQNIEKIKKVLVVDDNENNRIIVQEMLASKNIETEQAEDGLEALMKLKKGNIYDVIIMDYHMPDMDGLETIKNIRNISSLNADNQPIVLLSSSSNDESILAKCKEFGVQQRLVKPVKIHQLYAALSSLNDIQTEETVDEKIDFVEVKSTEVAKEQKILIVDDNTVNLLLAQTIIQKILPNASITKATNGKQAVELFMNIHPDLVFMDVQMPELNGYEAATAIRKLENATNVPIIALTAGTVLGEKERCIEAGMNDYLSKPFVKEAIEKMINTYL
ncbi:MAG: hypothetical protein RLZZ175_984 [Bacteroidota bacterium]|jgi:PAS domain S-box-containing protein